MIKICIIKPELYRNVELFDAEKRTGLPLRLAFIGLRACCDRGGHFKWQARSLKLAVLPYDDVDFTAVLNALCEIGFIKKLTVEGKRIGFIQTDKERVVSMSITHDSSIPSET